MSAVFGLIFLIAIVMGYQYYWKSTFIRTLWDSYDPNFEQETERVDIESHDLSSIFDLKLKRRNVYLFILDDLDFAVAESVNQYNALIELYQHMRQKQMKVMVLVSYNPFNNLLREQNGTVLRKLESNADIDKTHIDLVPFTHVQIDSILSSRYESYSKTARDILSDIVEEKPLLSIIPEAEDSQKINLLERADILFKFFEYLEDQQYLPNNVEVDNHDISLIKKVNARELFREFAARNSHLIEELISLIDANTNGLGQECKDILKCILAFKMEKVPESTLYKMIRELGSIPNKSIFDTSISYLIKLNIIRKVRRNRYSFIDSELKLIILSTVWQDWNVDNRYTDLAFNTLLARGEASKVERIALQALESNPSREAVDILIKEATYFQREFGESYYALKYFTNAFQKWRALILKLENPLDILRWKGTEIHSYNPNLSKKSRKVLTQEDISPVELCLDLGT